MSQDLTSVFCTCGQLLYKVDESKPYHVVCKCPECGLTLYRKGYGIETQYGTFEEVFIMEKR